MRRKLIGDPGTGKTTKLVEIAQELGIDNVTFCTFTVSALEEFGERFNLNPKLETRHWNTLHGLLCRLLVSLDAEFKIRWSKTKQLARDITSVRAKFCREKGLHFNPLDPFTEDEGKRFFSQYSYYVNKYYPNYINKIEDPWVYDLAKQYDEFKEKNGYVDFEDILMFAYDCKVNLPTDHFIVDEAMDLSPLQWEIVEHLGNQADEFIVAGDELQSIFSFQGAEPALFSNLKVDEVEVLPQTYRVPENIWRFSEVIIKNQLKRKRAKPIKGGGILKYIGVVDFERLSKIATKFKDVFVLFRTNDLVAEFSAYLTKKGIPNYHLKAPSIWATDFILFVRAYHKLKKGQIPDKDEAQAFLKRCRNPDRLRPLLEGSAPLFIFDRDPMVFIDESLLTPMERTAFRAFRDANIKKFDFSSTVIVDTIHSAKGREANTVILVDGITERIYRELSDPQKLREEERVWYVGVTRAKRNLIICRLANTIPFLTEYFGRWRKDAAS